MSDLIRPSVLAKWHAFSEPLEGRVHHMYLDVKGLVTTGVGNLIDPLPAALVLPWVHDATGVAATKLQVRTAWRAVKGATQLAKMHYKHAKPFCPLHLTDEAIDHLVGEVLHRNAGHLEKTFPAWRTLPADAQLGMLSMAWAVGPGFPRIFRNFTRLVLAGDWQGAREACKIRTIGNPGIIPRNKANQVAFGNAGAVLATGSDPSRLWWPEQYVDGGTITAKAPKAAKPSANTKGAPRGSRV